MNCAKNLLVVLLLLTCNAYLRSTNAQVPQRLVDARCPPPPTGFSICIECLNCGCGQICCPNGCGSSCVPIPLPQELDCLAFTSCSRGVCDGATCPAFPEATCTPDCNCRPAFLDCNGQLLSNSQCNPLPPSHCLPGVPTVSCFVRPCRFAKCPKVPEAQCHDNYCGGCNADFIDPNGDVILTREECQPGCGKSPLNCLVNPCQFQTCRAFPEATCRTDRCGQCQAIFTYNQRFILTEEQCNPPTFQTCVPLYDPSNSNLIVSCINGDRIGSKCTINCPKGYTLEGVSHTQCMANGHWVPSLGNTRCILQATTCQPPAGARAFVNFLVFCTNQYEIGSVCLAYSCPAGQQISGPTFIRCDNNGQWSPSDFTNTRCVCPRGSPQVRCSHPPCLRAKCPKFTDALCKNNYCGRCGFDFYRKGERLSRDQCIAQDSCFSQRFCGDSCSGRTCPSHPDAICKVNCSCEPIFHDPITLQIVHCYRRG